MKFARVVSSVKSIFLFMSFQLNIDLDFLEFVPYCDWFLIGTSTSAFLLPQVL